MKTTWDNQGDPTGDVKELEGKLWFELMGQQRRLRGEELFAAFMAKFIPLPRTLFEAVVLTVPSPVMIKEVYG